MLFRSGIITGAMPNLCVVRGSEVGGDDRVGAASALVDEGDVRRIHRAHPMRGLGGLAPEGLMAGDEPTVDELLGGIDVDDSMSMVKVILKF